MSTNYPRLVQPALRLFAVCGGLALPLSAVFAASDSAVASGDKMHWEVGLTYASGVNKVMDQLERNFGVTKKSVWPVGLKLGGYDEFSNGWGFGASVGPCMVIEVENGYGSSDNNFNYIIPVTFDARYSFPIDGKAKGYVRFGVTEPFASGDYFNSSTPGPVVAIGAEVWHGSSVSVGIEAGYDGSKVEVKGSYYAPSAKVTPIGFNASVFVRF
jgi:hypothetical protein